jgi:hypothetical protein
LIKHGGAKKALTPFVENEVSKIAIDADRRFENPAEITKDNFGDYLSEDSTILPEWESGQVVDIDAKIVSLQCTRGESMKIRVKGKLRKDQLIVLLPPNGKTTQDYKDFYGKDVWLKATVTRNNLYQKPVLIIQEIGIVQSSF